MSVLTEDDRDMMLQKVYAMLTELMARAEKPRRARAILDRKQSVTITEGDTQCGLLCKTIRPSYTIPPIINQSQKTYCTL